MPDADLTATELAEASRLRTELYALADLVTPMALRVAATLRLTDRIAEGLGTAPELAAAVGFMHSLGRRTAAWHELGFDLLLTPTCGQPPPQLGELVSTREQGLLGFVRAAPYGLFTSPFNLTGQPAISLPLHWTPEGLPVGVQLVAAYGREDMLSRVAAQLESAVPWSDRHPAL